MSSTTRIWSRPRAFATLLTAFVLTVIGGLVAPPAAAQGQGESPVKMRAVPQFDTVAPGGKLVVAIEMDMGEKFHAWPAKGMKLPLPADVDENLIRTEIGVPKDDSDKPKPLPAWLAKLDGIQYPETKVGKVADPSGSNPTIEVPLYSHKVVAYARWNVAPNAAPGEQKGEIVVTFQVCDEKTCLAPEDRVLSFKVKVAPESASEKPKANEPALFEKFDASKWGSAGGGGAATPPAKATAPAPVPTTKPAPPADKKSSMAPPADAPEAPRGANLFGLDLGRNIFVLALAAMVAGFVLNLTPCVLPVIPIKVLTLTKHASSKSHAFVLGLWMALGVVAFWGVIGIPMAFISAKLDPSQFIFGIWWITLSIGLIVALMGLGIMGLFTINLPQSVYMVDATADGPMGSFLFGVMTAVLGLPCFGFVAGGLLAAAATLPALTILIIFIGMGVGMAAPYLVFSIYPNLLKFMPRTGPGSDLVKQVMGLLLLAAAAFFVTAGIQALLKELPYLAGSMTWWAVGFFIAIAAIWMTFRTLQIAKSPIPKVIIPILGVVMTLGIGVFARGELTKDRATYLERQQAMGAVSGGRTSGDVPAGVWLEYTPELFAAVRASGRPVFLDFTADWCITCKAFKSAVLDRDPVKTLFKQRGVVLMSVDCTVRGGPGSKFLTSLERTGVPQCAIYGPGAEKPVFVHVETPTSAVVIAALDEAGVPAAGFTSGVPVTASSQR